MKKAKVFVVSMVLCMSFLFSMTAHAVINKSGETNDCEMDFYDEGAGGGGYSSGTIRKSFEYCAGPWSFTVTYTIYGGNVTGVSVKADNFMNRAKIAKWIKGSRYVEISGAYRDLSKNKWVDAKTSLYLM